jgi:cellulose biosynthesis protein BcsQ
VAVWDRDPQGSARTSLENSKVFFHPEEADITIIDTPPTISGDFDDAVKIADRVVLVATPYPVDLWASKTTAEKIRELRGEKSSKILFNRVRKGTTFGDQDLQKVAETIGLPALKSSISFRESFAQAHLLHWKALPAKHREEVFSAALEIVT